MNERERLVRTLTCSGPDRPSYGDYFGYDSTRERWEREGLPKGLDRDGLFDYFGMDHIDIWGRDNILKAESYPTTDTVVLEETDEYIVQTTEMGQVKKVLKHVPPPAMPQWLSYPVTGRKSWAEFKWRLNPDMLDLLPAKLSELGRGATRATPLCTWVGGTFGYIRNWLGLENASYAFYDDPALIEEIIEHLTFYWSTLLKRIFASGAQPDWVMFWEDMAYNHGSLLSPELYRKYCLPFYRVMVDILHQNGVTIIAMDSDGDVRELLPLWIDIGINVFHPMEVAAGMDVREIRRRYGHQATFLGGIDKRALAKGRKAIDEEVIPKIRDLCDAGGGFIAEVDHGIPPDISFADYCYFRDLVRSLSE